MLQTLKNAQKRTHVWEFYESYLRLVSGNLVQRQFTVNSNAFMIVWLKRKSKLRLVNELLMNTVNTVQDLFSKEGVWHPTYDFSAAISGIKCRHGLGQKGFLFCKFYDIASIFLIKFYIQINKGSYVAWEKPVYISFFLDVKQLSFSSAFQINTNIPENRHSKLDWTAKPPEYNTPSSKRMTKKWSRKQSS